MEVVSIHGLGGLTIGAVAERTGLSKSGLFAHFGSKQELQLATLRAVRRAVERDVVAAARAAPPGVSQLIALTEAYLASVRRPGSPGCRVLAAVAAVDGVSPPVRAAVTRLERRMFVHLLRPIRLACRSGELASSTDPLQLAFEILALLAAADAWTRVHGGLEGAARARRGIEARLLVEATLQGCLASSNSTTTGP
jgi:AcrR family transcriptional regulator